MGRSFIRAALNSARNVHPQDNPAGAAAARRIQGFHELDGIGSSPASTSRRTVGQDRNVVKVAVEPDHPDYAPVDGCRPRPSGGGTSGAPGSARIYVSGTGC